MMQLAKKIPFEDPMVLNGVRGLYLLSNVVIVGLYIYIGKVIKKKNGPSSPLPPSLPPSFPPSFPRQMGLKLVRPDDAEVR